MNELTKNEKNRINNFINEIYDNIKDQSTVKKIIENYSDIDGTFEYKFLYQRIKIAFETGQKSFLKVSKEIKSEISSAPKGYKSIFAEINNNYVVYDWRPADHWMADAAVHAGPPQRNYQIDYGEPVGGPPPGPQIHPQEIDDEMPF